jgi:hypothetical protein
MRACATEQTASNDRGQAVMLGLVWVVVAAVLVVAVVGFGARLGEAQRAQHVADAAALAAVDGDRALAQQVAALDGGTIVSIEWRLAAVGVTVRVGSHTATAWASRAP